MRAKKRRDILNYQHEGYRLFLSYNSLIFLILTQTNNDYKTQGKTIFIKVEMGHKRYTWYTV